MQVVVVPVVQLPELGLLDESFYSDQQLYPH